MGRQLLDREPVFREMIERCDAIVRALGPWSLLAELTADESRSRMAITAVSQPAISQHLAVLRGAGLVSERRQGRHAYYRAAPEGLAPLVDWIARYRAFWPARIRKLKDLLKEME